MTRSTESLSPLREQIVQTNKGYEASASSASGKSVIEVVIEILGYDIFEQELIAKGSWEMAEESLHISESNLAAGYETFPSE